MKVLLVNKFYYPRGGDCNVVINTKALLEENGHEVALFAMQHPDTIATEYVRYFPSEISFSPGVGMLEAFMRPFGTSEVKKKFTQLLSDFKPDVVHLHNIHSQLSPIVAKIAYEKGIPVVWTLHDYKLLCPRYDCLRNGETVCEECFTGKSKVLSYKCMKNSLPASLLAFLEAKKWNKGILDKYTTTFIGPSQFMSDKMVQGGFSPNKVTTLCNFIDIDKCDGDYIEKDEYYCYVGRLSHEKGIETLIKAAQHLPYTLRIVGGGPLEEELSKYASSNVIFDGYKTWDELKEIVGKAKFLVVPSEWYENNPLSVIEAQCLGTPVLGAKIGGIPELIDEQSTGLLFESGNEDDLSEKIKQMWASTFDYKKIIELSKARYSKEAHYNKLISIYNK